MSEEQIDKYGILEGTYKFRVIEVTSGYSKTNNRQIILKLKIDSPDGDFTISCYLGTTSQFMLRRLRHFCKSTGLMKEYESKSLTPDLLFGCEGLVELGVEKGGVSQDGRQYPDKTGIIDFVGEKESNSKTDSFDDKIPF